MANNQCRREPPYRPTLDDASASGSKRSAISAVTFVLLAMLLAGCFHHPLGMSEAQWLAFTPEQQREAHSRHAKWKKGFDRIREAEELRIDDAYSVD